MLTGEIRSQVDRVWDAFWSGGISNSMEVIEQLTYLLFIKRLDELHTLEEAKTNRLGQAMEKVIFPEGQSPYPLIQGQEKFKYDELRWSRFKNFEPKRMYTVVADGAFPFMKSLGNGESAYAAHMKEARFTLPPEKAGLLAKVVDIISDIPMDDRDTKGDVYEYMLGKLAEAGQNGQFRTPRHIIKMMVAMRAPTPQDTICDPACGTAGFLVAASEYLRENHSNLFSNPALRQRFQGEMFHGFDFDSVMRRIASMNMLLHGVENPQIVNHDSLSEDHAGMTEQYTLVLANPPFAGSLDYESTAKDLLTVVRTRKTELLFLRLLKAGGRAAVIVPDGVLFGSSRAHKDLRKTLVENQRLEAVISMPSGVFKPYAGVSTAILLFTKTDAGGTDRVWFYDMQADGFSLDDKRTPLNDDKHENNNIPDILVRWENLATEAERARTEQSFFVLREEIAANDYDLSINRYKEIVYEEIAYDPPKVILDELDVLEEEIRAGIDTLRGILS